MNKRTYKIGELSTLLKRGITPSYTDEHLVKVVNQKCIRGFQINLDLARYTDPVKKNVSDEKYLKNFDVLVNSTGVGTLGRVAQIFEINQPTTADSHITIIRPNQQIVDPLYFGYYMKSIQKNIEMLGEGSTGQTELSRVLLSDLEIDIIENIEQQRIVSEFLKVIDTKIELNQQVNKTLEEISKTLFKSWFIDFDPVRAKVEKRPTGLSKEISDLFPDSFEDSELGEIPKGWKIYKLEEILDRVPVGKRYSNKSSLQEGKIPIIDQSIDGIIGYHNNDDYIEASSNIPVMTFSNHTCNLRIVDFNFSTIQNVIPLKPKNLPILWTYIRSQDLQKFEEYRGHIPDFLIKKIPVPKKLLSDNFESIIKPLYSKLFSNKKENQILTSLRDTLLPKLISGELKITDAENLVEEAGI